MDQSYRRDRLHPRDEGTTFRDDRVARESSWRKHSNSLPNGNFAFGDDCDCFDDETLKDWPEDCLQKGNRLTSCYLPKSWIFPGVVGVLGWNIKGGDRSLQKRRRNFSIRNLRANKIKHSQQSHDQRSLKQGSCTSFGRLAWGFWEPKLQQAFALPHRLPVEPSILFVRHRNTSTTISLQTHYGAYTSRSKLWTGISLFTGSGAGWSCQIFASWKLQRTRCKRVPGKQQRPRASEALFLIRQSKRGASLPWLYLRI